MLVTELLIGLLIVLLVLLLEKDKKKERFQRLLGTSSEMGSGCSSWSNITLCFLLVLMCAQGSFSRRLTKWNEEDRVKFDQLAEASDGDQWVEDTHDVDNGHQKMHAKQVEYGARVAQHMDHMDPSLHVFFTLDDLNVGTSMPIYFKDSYSTSHLLSREEANSIPFSSAQLPYLLKFFSFSMESPQARAMEYTLKQCEIEPMKGETKFCATSLESMLDFTRGIFGTATNFKVLAATSTKPTLLQNYTILEVPKGVFAPKMVACHALPYPYAVFYCHSQEGENKLFEISLGSENGERVEAPAVCHMDTSQWNPDHMSFRVLRTKPGTSPVCHFFPADNLVWVPNLPAA